MTAGGGTVAIVGTRFADFSVEHDVLDPVGGRITVTDALDGPDVVRTAGDADVLLVGARTTIDAAAIDGLTCRAIVRYGVGVERIDLDAAAKRGIWVVNVPSYGAEAVATHALALILAGVRRVTQADRSVRDGRWTYRDLLPMHLPSELNAGVIGFGRIGSLVAASLVAIGFRVHVHDPFIDETAAGPGIARVPSLPELLSISDVVSLHVPGNQDCRPLLDASMLEHMRDGSGLVNTARGTLVDQAALVDGLARGRPSWAALDVFDHEPPDLSAFEHVSQQVVFTPHMAWYTAESELELRRKAAEEAARVLVGEAPSSSVVSPAGRAS